MCCLQLTPSGPMANLDASDDGNMMTVQVDASAVEDRADLISPLLRPLLPESCGGTKPTVDPPMPCIQQRDADVDAADGAFDSAACWPEEATTLAASPGHF